MTEQKLPQAISSAVMKLGDLELVVHVLDNGQRVVDAESFARFMESLGDIQFTEEDAIAVARHIKGV